MLGGRFRSPARHRLSIGTIENIIGTFNRFGFIVLVSHASHIASSAAVLPTIERLRAAFPAGALASGDGGDWSPDLALPASLWEIFGSGDDVSAEAFALACARTLSGDSAPGKPWLWVQDRASIRRSGRPYLHGLSPRLRSQLVHIAAPRPVDALWAMEEGVRCRALSFVIGELAQDPKSLDFTATRRLVLASEASGVPLILVRKDGHANLSAARMRWRATAGPSLAHRWNARAPGAPTCRAELFRARGLRPGAFHLGYGIGGDDAGRTAWPGDRVDLVPELRDRPLDADRLATG